MPNNGSSHENNINGVGAMNDKNKSQDKASKSGFADKLGKAASAFNPSIEEEAKRAQGLAEERSKAAFEDFERDVLPVERATISEQRKARGFTPAVENDYTGLALSGGGIRSASFALGVLEALHATGLPCLVAGIWGLRIPGPCER